MNTWRVALNATGYLVVLVVSVLLMVQSSQTDRLELMLLGACLPFVAGRAIFADLRVRALEERVRQLESRPGADAP